MNIPFNRIVAALAWAAPESRVMTSPAQMAGYDADALGYKSFRPDLVVIPGSAEEMSAVIQTLHEARVPICMRGAGTSLSGGPAGGNDPWIDGSAHRGLARCRSRREQGGHPHRPRAYSAKLRHEVRHHPGHPFRQFPPLAPLLGRHQHELVRSDKVPSITGILRADGLRLEVVESNDRSLKARVDGTIFGEIVVQTTETARVMVNGAKVEAPWDPATGTFTIPFTPGKTVALEVRT